MKWAPLDFFQNLNFSSSNEDGETELAALEGASRNALRSRDRQKLLLHLSTSPASCTSPHVTRRRYPTAALIDNCHRGAPRAPRARTIFCERDSHLLTAAARSQVLIVIVIIKPALACSRVDALGMQMCKERVDV